VSLGEAECYSHGCEGVKADTERRFQPDRSLIFLSSGVKHYPFSRIIIGISTCIAHLIPHPMGGLRKWATALLERLLILLLSFFFLRSLKGCTCLQPKESVRIVFNLKSILM
jgi:hypothetical protein